MQYRHASNNIRKVKDHNDTAVELVKAMKKWQIGGEKNSNLHNNDIDKQVKYVLINQNTTKTQQKRATTLTTLD